MVYALIAWPIVTAIVCGLAFIRTVAGAFGRTPSPIAFGVLWVGLRLGDGNALLVLGISWLMWTALGIGFITAISYI